MERNIIAWEAMAFIVAMVLVIIVVMTVAKVVDRRNARRRSQEAAGRNDDALHRQVERGFWTFQKWTGVISLLVSGFSVGAAAFAAYYIQGQLTIAREQQRPWIKVDAFPDGTLNEFWGYSPPAGVAMLLPLSLAAQNVGASPATNVTMWYWDEEMPPEGVRANPSTLSPREVAMNHCKELEKPDGEFIAAGEYWKYPGGPLFLVLTHEQFQKLATHYANGDVGVTIRITVCAVYQELGGGGWHHTFKTFEVVRHRGGSEFEDTQALPDGVKVPRSDLGFHYIDGSAYMD